MATPPDSPIEEGNYEIEPSRLPKHRPVALDDLCRQTKFTRQEIRVMYRGFKQVGSARADLLALHLQHCIPDPLSTYQSYLEM